MNALQRWEAEEGEVGHRPGDVASAAGRGRCHCARLGVRTAGPSAGAGASAGAGPRDGIRCLVSTRTAASSHNRPLAAAKLKSDAASPTIRSTPGDSDVACKPNARSRGQMPARQASQ